MSLPKHWQTLERSTVGKAPERWGVYELGDEDGNVLAVEAGVLRDELKTALAYRDAPKVRWETTPSRERAEELAAEHRERAGL
jgi:hypothetical protein